MFIQIYNSLIRILYPLVIKRYINKRKENGKEDVARFHERLGRPQKPRENGKLIWMHGASVGESVSMLPLINRLLELYPDLQIMVTTGTVTSADLMSRRLPERAFHQYVPIDNPAFVKRFLKHWHPDLVLWFESEFWPALLSGIKKRNIPLILVNGRISNKSFKRWQQFDYISKELLGFFTLCLGQSEEDAYRLRVLGAKDSLCLGNIKYAGINPPVDAAKLEEIRIQIGERPIWVASSTHHDEETRIARIHQNLKKQFPGLLTLIAPRHPQRGPGNPGKHQSSRPQNRPAVGRRKNYSRHGHLYCRHHRRTWHLVHAGTAGLYRRIVDSAWRTEFYGTVAFSRCRHRRTAYAQLYRCHESCQKSRCRHSDFRYGKTPGNRCPAS